MLLIRVYNRETALWGQMEYLAKTQPVFQGETRFTLQKEPLPLGDIIVSWKGQDQWVIERKTVRDLSASIKDGRYVEQSYRLGGGALQVHPHNIVYLIEGSLDDMGREKVDKRVINSALFSLHFFKGFSVIRTLSLEESAFWICNSAFKMHQELYKGKMPFYSALKNLNVPQLESKIVETTNETQVETLNTNDIEENVPYVNVVAKVKKDNITPQNIGEIMLAQIPGISSASAVAIMKSFTSLEEMLEALRKTPEFFYALTLPYSNPTKKGRRINTSCIDSLKLHLLGKEKEPTEKEPQEKEQQELQS